MVKFINSLSLRVSLLHYGVTRKVREAVFRQLAGGLRGYNCCMSVRLCPYNGCCFSRACPQRVSDVHSSLDQVPQVPFINKQAPINY